MPARGDINEGRAQRATVATSGTKTPSHRALFGCERIVPSIVFSIFNTVVLDPLPFAQPDRLVWLSSLSPRKDERQPRVAFTDVKILSGPDSAERVNGFLVTANLFSMLGVSPEIGRTFRPDEERSGEPQVVILSHGFWESHYGGDPGAVRSRMILDGSSIQIVGVMPPGSDFPSGANQPR